MRKFLAGLFVLAMASLACNGIPITIGEPVPCGQMATLSGKTVDAITKAEVKSKWVVRPAKSGDEKNTVVMDKCGESSTCSVSVTSCGIYDAEVKAPGYKPAEAKDIKISSTISGIVVELTPVGN